MQIQFIINMYKTGHILTLALFSILLGGCSYTTSGNYAATSDSNGNTSNSVSDAANENAEQLGLLIKLPFEAEEVVWKEQPLGKQDAGSRVPSQNERKLVAVFRFSDEESAKLVSSLARLGAATQVALSTEEWYPSELVAQSEFNGEAGLRGESYPAGDFYQSPYLNGNIARIVNTNYFVLELFSK